MIGIGKYCIKIAKNEECGQSVIMRGDLIHLLRRNVSQSIRQFTSSNNVFTASRIILDKMIRREQAAAPSESIV